MNGQHMMWIDSTLPLSFDPVSSVSCFGGGFPGPHHLPGFIWLHFASFGLGWADSVHEAKQCQEAQEDFLQTITVWSLDSEAFLYGEDDAEWCRMMQNEHEWTKQSRSNLRVQLVEADLNSTNLFGNSDDDNLLAGEPFPLRYWHYGWHECECHSAVRQRESEEICTVGKRTKVLCFRIRNW